MRIDLYKNSDDNQFLLIGPGDQLPEHLGVTLLQEDIPLINASEEIQELPLISHLDLAKDILRIDREKGRTRDAILFENEISSFKELQAHYFLIRQMQSNLSSNIRRLVVEKYSEVISHAREVSSTDENMQKTKDGSKS